MRKKVGMFVWNHFTNDARVLRECTALVESGYEVDLFCIDDPNDQGLPSFEQRNEFFRITRVRRYPILFTWMQKCKKHPLLLLPLLLIYLFSLVYLPIPTISLSVLIIGLLKTKLRVIWVRGGIIARMIILGWIGRYDIYHSNDLNTLPQGYICAKWRWKKKKLIYDSHEVQTSRTGYDGKSYGILERFLIKRIDKMIVENQTRAKYNEELYGFYPAVVHNYPFNMDSNDQKKVPLHDLLRLPPSEKILLYQGGIQVGRGLEQLIQAVPLFDEGTLVMIGDGRLKPKLEEMVEEMELKEKVKFLPKVPLVDLPKYTRNAYIGFQVLNNVCFNHYSASSNKLFEYLMAGVPVVACQFPEIKRVVEGDETGICVDSHDYREIARGVNELLSNPEKYMNMRKNCKIASRKYNWEKEKHYLTSVYDHLLNEDTKKNNSILELP
ncbi:glycosyltransferase [Heyndrickxia sp. NPDC080065]|uniref:glycosyltransferase n=1 Tax=Heyndrickxia sp. NPDC080065 TaxID=3390568 RepID=UPI003D02CA7D